MSADNYIVIRKLKDGWRWGMGFMSDWAPQDLPLEKLKHGPYETLVDAEEACEGEYLEYGVYIYDGPTVEISTAMLEQLHDALGELIAERDWWKDEPRCGYQRRWNEDTKLYMQVAWLLGDDHGHAAVGWVKQMREGK